MEIDHLKQQAKEILQDRPMEAYARYQRCLQIAVETYGFPDREFAILFSNMSKIAQMRGDLDNAIHLADAAIEHDSSYYNVSKCKSMYRATFAEHI